MRQLKAFVKKEFLHVFRDTRTMLILFGMPVAQIILFGFAISTEVRNIDLAMVVPQSSEVTRRLTEKFDASEYFTVRKILRSTDGIERYFRDGSISMAVAFTPGFADEMLSPEGAGIQLITDGSNTNTARTAAGYATAVIKDALSEGTAAEAAGIQTDVRMLFNPQMRSSYNFVPGVMGLIIILICAMMTSIAIVREKETGTMEVLLVSPPDYHPHLRHDDLHRHSQGEGDRHDGGAAGLPDEAADNHSVQDDALHGPVHSELPDDSAAVRDIAGHPSFRELLEPDPAVADLHRRFPRLRPDDFHPDQDSARRHARLRDGADDTGGVPFGASVPGRKHAGILPCAVRGCSGPLVHRGREEANDRRAARRHGRQGVRNTLGHGRIPAGRQHQKL